MKLTTYALPVLLVLVGVPAQAAPTTGACVLPAGLYARRQILKKQYSEQVGSGYLSHKAAVDHTKAQLRLVDQHYQELFSTLCGAARDGDTHLVAWCCAKVDHDPPAGEVCNLAHYLVDERGDSTRFVETFPETPQEITVLWNLEEITYGPQGSMVKDCGPSGLVDLYVDKLFHLVALGDRRALVKFVNLSHHAEGVFAEGLADRMKHLLVEKPRLVLEQWSIIKGFSHIQEIGAEFVDDEQATAERNFDKLCARPSQACAEIQRAISSPRN